MDTATVERVLIDETFFGVGEPILKVRAIDPHTGKRFFCFYIFLDENIPNQPDLQALAQRLADAALKAHRNYP